MILNIIYQIFQFEIQFDVHIIIVQLFESLECPFLAFPGMSERVFAVRIEVHSGTFRCLDMIIEVLQREMLACFVAFLPVVLAIQLEVSRYCFQNLQNNFYINEYFRNIIHFLLPHSICSQLESMSSVDWDVHAFSQPQLFGDTTNPTDIVVYVLV